MANGGGQQYWVDNFQGNTVSDKILFKGKVDGELQLQSMNEVNKYITDSVGHRKLENSDVEKAIMIAMQNVAAGADPLDELEKVSDSLNGVSESDIVYTP